VDECEPLVDGGYLNSIPVDVMRERMGVETVVVVDVEDNDYLAGPRAAGRRACRHCALMLYQFTSGLFNQISDPPQQNRK
jgi:predicted acylesterase/phospholipase RssA